MPVGIARLGRAMTWEGRHDMLTFWAVDGIVMEGREAPVLETRIEQGMPYRQYPAPKRFQMVARARSRGVSAAKRGRDADFQHAVRIDGDAVERAGILAGDQTISNVADHRFGIARFGAAHPGSPR